MATRIPSLDIIRGFALLGILTMNISLGLPGAARLNPLIASGFEGANFVVWVFGYLFFDEKMISLFSMLFGAGLLLANRHPIRRQASLLVIGLLHAYLIWEGDILFFHALCGLIVYPLRKLSGTRLLLCALAFWLPSIVFSYYFGQQPGMAESLQSSPEQLRIMVAQKLESSWLQLVIQRAPETFTTELILFFGSFGWTISARMLLGMALLKSGFLDASLPAKTYVRLALCAYAVGLPLVFLAMHGLLTRNFNAAFLFSVALSLNQAGGQFVAIAHASVLLFLLQTERAIWLLRALAAVGRMALTNYLMQSLILTTIFYGYGFGQFGKWNRSELFGLVCIIWLLQIRWSLWWLKRTPIGPAEWLWRRAA